jgi:hypothetical protein
MTSCEYKLFLLVGVVFLGVARLDFTALSQTQEGVVVSYAMSPPIITLHEPIVVELSIMNDLNEQIRFDLGKNHKSKLLVTVKKPDGSLVRVPALSEEGLGTIGRLSLDPKQTHSERLLLNEWYDFNAAGVYQIEVRLADSIRTESGKIVNPMTKGALTLEVGPRRPELLRQRCERLARSILEFRSYADAAEAALALSYVQDTTAVPYLAKVMTAGRMVAPIAIAGLERIGGKESVDALILAVQSRTDEIAELARSALIRMANKATDLSIQERIKQAL